MSIPSGPYGPRNGLRDPAPKFGETTPMKSSLARREDHSTITVDDDSPVPSVHRSLDYMLEPIPAAKQNWQKGGSSRNTAISVDSSPDIAIISRPPNFTAVNNQRSNQYHIASKWATLEGVSRPINGPKIQRPVKTSTGFLGTYGVGVDEASGHATYYGGESLDPKKTHEALKALFENNDEPPARRTRKRRKEAEAANLKASETPSLSSSSNTQSTIAVSEAPAEEEEEGEEEEEEEEEDNTVDGLNITLLPHQCRGRDFLVGREEGKSRGGILADDMGLGKTVQSIALLLLNPLPNSKTHTAVEREKLKLPTDLDKGTLIIAPLALVKQWEAEIHSKTDGRFKVHVHHGNNRTRAPSELKRYDVVITTPQVLVSEHKDTTLEAPVACFGLYWWRIIVDEAHTIKNPSAKSTIACCALAARYRWCLTGTPLQNNVDELQSLLHFLRIQPFSDKKIWKEQITKPMKNNRGEIAIKRLQAVLGVVMLRRTKAVLQATAEAQTKEAETSGGTKSSKDKPSLSLKMVDRKVEIIQSKFSKNERQLYETIKKRMDERLDEMLDSGKNNMSLAFALTMRMRQACNHPKLLAGKTDAYKDSLFDNSQTPRKPKKQSDNQGVGKFDDIADMFTKLTVDYKTCQLCQNDLSREETENGETRCSDCNEILGTPSKKGKREKRASLGTQEPELADLMGNMDLRESRVAKQGMKIRSRRQIVLDSDDEDEEDERHGIEDSKADEDDNSYDERQQERLYPSSDLLDDEAIEVSGTESDIERHETGNLQCLNEETFEDDSEDDLLNTPTSQHYASTKIRQLMKILRREIEAGNKTIVFSDFTSMLDLIEPFLKDENMRYARYDGKMRHDHREMSLNRLRNNEECKILLCSLRCGALGLNLTAANRVVLLEPFWNPFVEEQAIDRVHRIGQTSDVVVYKLTVKDSVEDRMLDVQAVKRAIANATFGDGANVGDEAKQAKFNMKDILYLFGRTAEDSAKPHEIDELHARKSGKLDGNVPYSRSSNSRNLSQETRGPAPRRHVVERTHISENAVYGRR